MTASKMHMLMQLSCIQKFLMRKQKKVLLQIKIYLSGTSRIILQTCLLMIALDSKVNMKTFLEASSIPVGKERNLKI